MTLESFFRSPNKIQFEIYFGTKLVSHFCYCFCPTTKFYYEGKQLSQEDSISIRADDAYFVGEIYTL